MSILKSSQLSKINLISLSNDLGQKHFLVKRKKNAKRGVES